MAFGTVDLFCMDRIRLLPPAHMSSRGTSVISSGTAISLPTNFVACTSGRNCRFVKGRPHTRLSRWDSPYDGINQWTVKNPRCSKELGHLYSRGGSVGSSGCNRIGVATGGNAGLPTDGEAATESVIESELELRDVQSSNRRKQGFTPFEEEEVTEFQLSGDDTEVQEIGNSLYSFKTLKKVVFKVGDVGKQFVMNSIGGVVGIMRIGQKQKEPEVLAFATSMYESKDGVSAIHQWTATELTMQHAQLSRIATDINYLVFAFGFFGWVRVLEAVLATFCTNPPHLRKLMQATNAMDPLTVAWLAYNLRKPILAILQAEPTDLQKLATSKAKLWEELHAFFERQWKVMATIAMARFLGLIATNIPTSQWITNKVKLLWDMLMALPIF